MNLNEPTGLPHADIYETDAGYLIAVDLPGIDREALEIDVDDNRLIVKGTRVDCENQSNIALKDREENSSARSVFPDQSIRARSEPNTKMVFCRFVCRNAVNKKRSGSRSRFRE